MKFRLLKAGSTVNSILKGAMTKTGWLGIRIMCPNGATCLLADCCFIELAL
jgi:hypothetical protein